MSVENSVPLYWKYARPPVPFPPHQAAIGLFSISDCNCASSSRFSPTSSRSVCSGERYAGTQTSTRAMPIRPGKAS